MFVHDRMVEGIHRLVDILTNVAPIHLSYSLQRYQHHISSPPNFTIHWLLGSTTTFCVSSKMIVPRIYDDMIADYRRYEIIYCFVNLYAVPAKFYTGHGVIYTHAVVFRPNKERKFISVVNLLKESVNSLTRVTKNRVVPFARLLMYVSI